MNLLTRLTPRRLALGIATVGVAAAVVAILLAATSPRTLANAATARRGDISATVSATGKVQSRKGAKLALPQSGIVASVSKMEGDDVNAGDVILSLRADDANRRVQQAQLNLQNRQLDLARAKGAPRDEDIEIARANLQKATAAAAAAEANYTASPTTQNDTVRQVTRADLDIAKANFNRVVNGPSKEELDALQNAITAAQLDVDAARNSLAQTRLIAPYNSTVLEVNVREGELVGGFSPLAVIADLTALQIATEIDEIDVAHAQVGQTVQVRFDAFPGEQFEGKVTRLFPAASTQRGTTVYSAVVEFNPGAFKVRPGMGATMKIRTIEKKSVLLVPNRALKNVGTRKAVHVLAPGQERDVIVETGVTDGNETEIVSGLNEGDQVLVQ
ncbi:MAG: efflux RND transporter periplasmic adaptor subunit [Chloroflexi bacterium]|nr:efflux RND transporter periplasmic adaptor subunit [Chloroflexota bacterium]